VRVLKILVAASALTFGIGLIVFIAFLWIGGPSMADHVWTSPFLLIAYVLGLVVAARYIR
jgi:hypothetical protein